jgi:hypothetical protein
METSIDKAVYVRVIVFDVHFEPGTLPRRKLRSLRAFQLLPFPLVRLPVTGCATSSKGTIR